MRKFSLDALARVHLERAAASSARHSLEALEDAAIMLTVAKTP